MKGKEEEGGRRREKESEVEEGEERYEWRVEKATGASSKGDEDRVEGHYGQLLKVLRLPRHL